MLDIKLVKTCSACPEQYDAFYNGKQVGYLRLLNGCFRVDYGCCGGDTILYSFGVGGYGCFDDSEREYFLSKAIDAITKEIIKQKHY